MGTMRRLLPAMTLAALAACHPETTAPRPITALPRPLSSAEAGLVVSSNQFSINLLRETLRRSADTQNVFVSPLSFSMALGMTLNGAANATWTNIQHTLALDGMAQGDINVPPGATPLYRATRATDLTAIRTLLDKGANPNVAVKDGSTPLMVASGLGARRGGDEEIVEKTGRADPLDAVKLFVDAGAKVGAANDAGLGLAAT